MDGKKPVKKSYLPLIALIIAAAVVIGVVIIAYYRAGIPERAPLKEVSVFFGASNGTSLKAEKRSIKKGSAEAEAMEALTALIEGPKGELTKTLPQGTRLRGVTIKDATAVADFTREIIDNHGGGSSGEIQTVYSIVNTLTLNFPEIKQVQILVEGKKEKTIAGHIDISLPLGPDRKIIS